MIQRAIVLLVAAFAIVACAPRRASGPDIARGRETAQIHHSFVQAIPGSNVRITLRRVVDPSGAIPEFWIAETETTWDAYDVFQLRLDLPEDRRASPVADPGPDAVTRPTLPYAPPDRGWGHAGYPAIGITYHAAQAYCRWLSERTDRRFRLPSLAEWRLACGDAEGDATDAAWCRRNAGEQTHPVALKRPNAHGLYDMLGNVGEWCEHGPGGKPVVCGGSYLTPASTLSPPLAEPQTRGWQASQPNFPKSLWWLSDAPFVGFRVVCVSTPENGSK